MLKSKRESTPMYSHRLLRSQLLMNSHCLLGINVLAFQILSRQICANWKYTQVKSFKNITKFFENCTVASITRIKYFLACGRLNYKPSPKAIILIKHPSSRPVADWYKSDLKFFVIDRNLFFMSPIQLIHSAILRKHILGVQTSKKLTSMISIIQSLQSSSI